MKNKMILIFSLVLSLSFSTPIFAETIILKSGKKIEGKILERTDDYIRVEQYGMPITYFLDDIESINGGKFTSSLIEADSSKIESDANIIPKEAIKNFHVSEIREAIENGADVNSRDSDGYTALMKAAFYNSLEVAKLLIDNGAELNDYDATGCTALTIAAKVNSIDVAKLLIDEGADVNASGHTKFGGGFTALMAAASNNALEITKLLLENGADVNAKDSVGGTALMQAANENSLEVAKLLIDRGADLNVKDNIMGATAISLAKIEGHTEMVDFLTSHLGDDEVSRKEREGIYNIGDVIIKFIPPEGWVKVGQDSPEWPSGIQFIPPMPAAISAVLAILVTPRTVPAFADFDVNILMETAEDQPYILEKQIISFADTEAFSAVMDMEGIKVKQIQFIKNGDIVMISFTAEGQNFDKLLPVVNESLKSFEIISPDPK